MRRIARDRKQTYLSRIEDHHRLLVPSQDENHWSTSASKYRKDRMLALVTGKEASRRDTDTYRMRKHINNSSLEKARYPVDKRDGCHFNPIDVPILDILAMEADQEYGWKYPSKEALQEFQEFPRLADRHMLKKCTVKEIVLNGDQSEQEQLDIIAWHHERMTEDNNVFPYTPLSLDVEQVCCTLKDVLWLGGQQSYKRALVTLSDRPGDEHFGAHKDRYVQLPVCVM